MNQTSNSATALQSRKPTRIAPPCRASDECTDTGHEVVQKVCSAEREERADIQSALGTDHRTTRPRRVFALLAIIAVLAGLFFFSLRLAATRIFQVDECVEAYVARLIATGAAKTTAAGNFGLFELALSPLIGGAARSIEALLSARLVMVVVFWMNLLLITLASGQKLLSLRGALVLLGAATLAPLWDYGFEIRHDNPLLAGLLVMWCAARVSPGGMKSFFVIGILAVLLQFLAFKAFVYTVPISLFAFLFLSGAHARPRFKLAVAWCSGAAAALGLVRLVLGLAGLWRSYWDGSGATAGVAAGQFRFGPGMALERLLTQTPLLLAFAFAALGSVAWLLDRKPGVPLGGRLQMVAQVIASSPAGPELFLVLIALAALFINPTPFPYNLVNLVPFLYLLAVRYAASLADHIRAAGSLVAPLAGVLLFTHAVPFWLTTRRHLDWPNWRQDILTRKAEDLTDPVRDPVYDATGLVFTRPIVDVRAFIHSTNIKSLVEGSGPHLRDMWAANPPAVYLPNYRTDALAAEDHEFIRQHYVSLADDFWVLGGVVEPDNHTFEIIHSGRYRISTLNGSDIAGTYPNDVRAVLTPEEKGDLKASLDGKPLTNAVVTLGIGPHTIEADGGSKTAVVWVGPRLERIHRLANHDHRFLFVNWY